MNTGKWKKSYRGTTVGAIYNDRQSLCICRCNEENCLVDMLWRHIQQRSCNVLTHSAPCS